MKISLIKDKVVVNDYRKKVCWLLFLFLFILFFVFLVFKLYEMMIMYCMKVENVCFYEYDVLKIYWESLNIKNLCFNYVLLYEIKWSFVEV